MLHHDLDKTLLTWLLNQKKLTKQLIISGIICTETNYDYYLNTFKLALTLYKYPLTIHIPSHLSLHFNELFDHFRHPQDYVQITVESPKPSLPKNGDKAPFSVANTTKATGKHSLLYCDETLPSDEEIDQEPTHKRFRYATNNTSHWKSNKAANQDKQSPNATTPAQRR